MIFKYEIVCKERLKLNKVVIVSKFGSKISEDAAKMVAKKLLLKKIGVYTMQYASLHPIFRNIILSRRR